MSVYLFLYLASFLVIYVYYSFILGLLLLSLIESRYPNVTYIRRKAVSLFFGERLFITESIRPIDSRYPDARGFYFGGPRDEIWLKSNNDVLRLCSDFLHEVGHWTGHPTRNDRIVVGIRSLSSASSPEKLIRNKYIYAREELIAELISLKLRKYLSFPPGCTRDRVYLRHWMGHFKSLFPYKVTSNEQKQKCNVYRKVPWKEYRRILKEADEGFDYIISRKRSLRKITKFVNKKLQSGEHFING